MKIITAKQLMSMVEGFSGNGDSSEVLSRLFFSSAAQNQFHNISMGGGASEIIIPCENIVNLLFIKNYVENLSQHLNRQGFKVKSFLTAQQTGVSIYIGSELFLTILVEKKDIHNLTVAVVPAGNIDKITNLTLAENIIKKFFTQFKQINSLILSHLE